MKKKDPSLNREQLGHLLLRYKTILKPPQASVEKEAVAVITEVTGITLTTAQLSYTVHTRTLTIKAPSLLRSELYLKREVILSTLRQRLGEQSAPTTLI